jgi:hypothetical protein
MSYVLVDKSTEGQELTRTEQLDWPAESRPLLIKYRDAHTLPVRTLYRNPSAHHILSSGIGSRSPTMARDKAQRRCTKDEVAGVVRKHFRDTAVTETECLVEVMYRVKNKGMYAYRSYRRRDTGEMLTQRQINRFD